MATTAPPVRVDVPQQPESDQRVTALELFFDLVFVFALTQVTSLLAKDPTWGGLGRGLLMLAALWWAWAAYAWLTNTLNPEEGGVRLAMFVAMAAMLIASLAVPEAFDEHGVIFGAAYFTVRVMHLALYALAARGNPDLLGAVLRMTPTATVGPAIILLAGFVDGGAVYVLWTGALAMDYLGVLWGRAAGWTVSAGHFAERHGLIVIIALGESIVAIGLGASDTDLDAGVIAAALLGLAVSAAMWWAYFDVVAIVAERKLHEATGAARAAQARDSYSYIHLPMVAGIILFAFGVKTVLAHPTDELETVPAVSLFGGVALYLLAHVAFRLRNVHTLSPRRLVATVSLAVLLAATSGAVALVCLAAVAAVMTTLIAYEAIRYADARHRLRQSLA